MKPFAHQLVSLKHNETTDIVFDCSDAGTGKTGVRVFRYAKRKKKKAGCMLVLGLRSTLRSVWESDFKKFAPEITTSVATAANREAAFAKDVDVYITNHDAVKWLAKQKPAFWKKFDEIVVDESEFFKHYTSQRSKALLKLVKHFKYRTCMTATPNDNTIVDVWHQVLLLDNGARLGRLYFPFRNSVSTPVQVGHSANMVEWRDKEGAEDAVFGLLSDIVVRHRLDDCADIPENHQYPLMYEMSTPQKKAYMQMEASKMLDLGKLGGVTAINAAAVATKLLQVASGAVYDGTGKYAVIDTSRYELILDLCEQRKHPLVLFQWKHQRDLLVAEAEKRGKTFAVFDGDTTDEERFNIVQRYQRGQYDVLFAHPKTVGHGQTLTRGTSTIWASPTHLAAQFLQASSRQRRIGQTEKTETVVIIAEGTTDEWVYENCMRKDGRMKSLLELFAGNTPVPTKSTKTKAMA
jgi:SNF2 family DNA or RNA helicase